VGRLSSTLRRTGLRKILDASFVEFHYKAS
jgi:hypothetical protein